MAGTYSIKAVSIRTKLSPHVIRVWERRYGAIGPDRTDTNRRLYSEKDVEKLELLSEAIGQGHNIGSVAKLSVDELRQLTKDGRASAESNGVSLEDETWNEICDKCLLAVKQLDAKTLEQNFEKALITLGHHGLLKKVVSPLASAIGNLWSEGSITAAHEHFLTASVKIFLGHLKTQFATSETAPSIIVTTPIGQLHELGAIMAAVTAAQSGWKVTYLGPSLPAAEIAGAVQQTKSIAVALSLVFPEYDENLSIELQKLRQYLPKNVQIIIGGRASGSYERILSEINALQADTLDDFQSVLTRINQSRVDP